MTDWRRVSAILERALEYPPETRDALFLAEAGSDTALLGELRALARSHDQASAVGFIDAPLAAAQPDLVLNTLQPGQRLGTYEILDEAGRGGMGVVYRARDLRLGREVAIKCVAEGTSAAQRARLEEEAKLAARVDHPGFATVHALEEHAGQLFVVSEFVSGETLRERLTRGRMAGAERQQVALALADALGAAHRVGITHGDLKPENVMLRRDGAVKILDFGLGRRHRTSAEPVTSLAGTPGYMAPEQLRGDAPMPQADVFAFGVLLFEMATGAHPFAMDRGATLEAALSTRAAFDHRDLPPELAAIVRQSMAPQACDRFPDGAAVAAALRAAAPPPASRHVKWFLLHQRVVSGIAAAMPVIAWVVRPDLPRPWGAVAFIAILTGATAVVTLRMNADFVAREHPGRLAAHLRRTRPRRLAAELALDAAVLTAGIALIDLVDWAAGALTASAIASMISLSVIEPATIRAALQALPRRSD